MTTMSWALLVCLTGWNEQDLRGRQNQRMEPWQTSWSSFITAIAPFLKERPVDAKDAHIVKKAASAAARARFSGKSVLWEGEINSPVADVASPAIWMPAHKVEVVFLPDRELWSAFLSIVYFLPKEGSAEAWKKVETGKPFKFRGVVADEIWDASLDWSTDSQTSTRYRSATVRIRIVEAEPVLEGGLQ